MEELFGSNNAAKSQQLPHLRYKYKMNEPFVLGEQASVQDSHDQVQYKISELHQLGGLHAVQQSDEQQLAY
jgi:hypothetical protein